jgi:hypothetical protein
MIHRSQRYNGNSISDTPERSSTSRNQHGLRMGIFNVHQVREASFFLGYFKKQ